MNREEKKQLLQLVKNELPVTDDQEVMEQFVRMDYIINEDGDEVYASFTILADGTLFRLTKYKLFEDAWADYTKLFAPKPAEKIVVSVPRRFGKQVFLNALVKAMSVLR